MDAARFDALARSLTSAGSRRRALALALGGVLAPLLPRKDAEAHNALLKCKKLKGDRKKKCVKKAKKHNAAHASETPPPGPTCSDGVKNGSESDVDCGGSCQRCLNTKRCTGPNDCATAYCASSTCSLCPTWGAACGSDGGTTCTCYPIGNPGEGFCLNPAKSRGPCGVGGTCPSNEVCFINGAGNPICFALCGAP